MSSTGIETREAPAVALRSLLTSLRGTHLMRQPFVAIVTFGLSLMLCAHTIVLTGPQYIATSLLSGDVLVAALFVTALFFAYQYPIHLRQSVKIEMGSVPLYLMAALLPVPMAAIAAGIGTLVTELAVRKARGNLPSDIATQAGRWSVVVLAGSAVAHVNVHSLLPHLICIVAAAGVLLLGDILTMPLVVCPITGEAPGHIVLVGLRNAGLAEGVQYFLGLMGAIVSFHDAWAISLLLLPIALLYRISKRNQEMHEMTRRLLLNMADEVDRRDPYMKGHSARVTHHVSTILREMGLTGAEARTIITASRMHDVGKMWVPDSILYKHYALDVEERTIVARHPLDGAGLLRRYADFVAAAAIVEHHHERWDGKGYPHGISGTQIPLGSRVIAVADAFDAMTIDAPYRKAMPAERAAAVLAAGAGTQWDPEIVMAFLATIPDALPLSHADAARATHLSASGAARI